MDSLNYDMDLGDYQIQTLDDDEYPRQVAVFNPTKSTNKWDPRLILDLAIGVDSPEAVLFRHGLTLDDYEQLTKSQEFRRDLAVTIRDVKEHGLSFYQKAKTQAESYLEILDHLVYEQTTPASVRLEAIRSTVKWAKLEVDSKTEDGVNATQINVNISF